MTLIAVRQRSRNQSTGSSSAMYPVGKPTAVKTSVMVTRPASGIPAAPTEARTLVMTIRSCLVSGSSTPIIWATNSALIASYSAVPSLLKLLPTSAPRLADSWRSPTRSRRQA